MWHVLEEKVELLWSLGHNSNMKTQSHSTLQAKCQDDTIRDQPKPLHRISLDLLQKMALCVSHGGIASTRAL